MKKFAYLILYLVFLNNCGSDDDSNMEDQLMDVTTEVLYFVYTPDTGNNSSKLEYQLRFVNPNDFEVTGGAKVTTDADGLIVSSFGTNFSQCYMIPANSDCTYTFEAEDSHDLGMVTNISLVAAEYLITVMD